MLSMCPEHTCTRKETCYRYRAIPMGNIQTYMLGRGDLDEACSKYIEVNEETKYLSKDTLEKIDKKNKIILMTWQGRE